ncbi:tigger transposable element-derived protein 4-like [Periplaneta americana]|uniref:tigger transposable element-derived protein 4-like n=1 Tax=Periplaneta americana TaxID=6978 RepID=UPI0037E9C11F
MSADTGNRPNILRHEECVWNITKPIKASSEKKKGEVLSLKLRVEVIRESSNGLSQRALALKFNCSKTQIQNILKDKDRLLREWRDGGGQFPRRKRRQRHENVNNFVWEWFKEARTKGLPLSGPILQEKAREFAAFFNVDKFNASNGWLDSFKKRHNIVFRDILGESEAEGADWRSRVTAACEGYALRDVFSIEETGLFFRTVPDKMADCGSNLPSERVTLALCINVLGEKEPPVVVYCTHCRDSDAGVEWYTNSKSWMTPDIFSQWATKFNNRMVAENRKVLLFLHDAPCHPPLELSNVSLMFLPASSASCLRPLDQAFKLLYRRRMLRSLVARMNGSSITNLSQQVSVSDAVAWVHSAWADVKPSVAHRLFTMCGIKMAQAGAALEDDVATELDDVAVEVSSLGEVAGITVELDSDGSRATPCYDVGSDWGDEEVRGLEQPKVDALPLNQALSTIDALKALAAELECPKRLTQALHVAEEEFENIIVKRKCVNMCNKTSRF